MIIKVDRCWNGHRTTFRLTTPNQERELICAHGEAQWGRKYATQALDVFETLYGYSRRNIRFDTTAA